MIQKKPHLAVLACLMFAVLAAAPGAAYSGEKIMNTASDCSKNVLTRSKCMIEAVLADVMATYTRVGGGGITDIRLVATDTYAVSIAQEERIDKIIYQLTITKDGKVAIASRDEETVSPGQ